MQMYTSCVHPVCTSCYFHRCTLPVYIQCALPVTFRCTLPVYIQCALPVTFRCTLLCISSVHFLLLSGIHFLCISSVHFLCTSSVHFLVHSGVHFLFPLDICHHFTVFTGSTQQLVKRSPDCYCETLTTLTQGYTALEWKERWYETNALHMNSHPLSHCIVAPLSGKFLWDKIFANGSKNEDSRIKFSRMLTYCAE